MPTYQTWNAVQAADIIASHRGREGATLPILHELQATFGCIPRAAVPMVADALNLTRAEVHGRVAAYFGQRGMTCGPVGRAKAARTH